ncbi:glycosyltransferase family 2 protein [Granulicella aggregans]|uniref:glycosyltransferase family 2 protein n=1 Tax=Granulicella aggregans TaxID=474949 RepID=UPI0021DFF91A|nr:glycosyltransferase family 2 protein [Granulicella aggregans]
MARLGLIGVVTVTYNSATVLPSFLECLTAQTHREFILFAVDNASNDATIQMLTECSDDRIRVIANAVNVGVAEGNNQGIAAAIAAGCSSVWLLNNDTEFDNTLLAQLATNMVTEQVGMICPKIMYYDEPGKIWAAGGTFQQRYGYRSVHYGEGELDQGQYDEQRLVTYVPTCCVLISAEVFEKVGMMDPRYFVYVDDVDFMYRAMKDGIRLLYFPRAKLLHKVSSLTGQEESISMIRFCTRNRVFFLLKHFGLLRSSPLLLGYQIHFLIGRLTGKLKNDVYFEKQRAVKRGYEMWRASLSEPPH